MAIGGGNSSQNNRNTSYTGNMASNLRNRIPYNHSLLDTDESLNTKYKYFQKVGMRRPEAIAKNSVALNNDYNTAYSNIHQDRSFKDLMYAGAIEDKPVRLSDYRTIAAFSEVSDALDEICDETINVDDNGNIVVLSFKNSDLDSNKKEELQNEFSKYIECYDLENNGWSYFRQFLIEGELYFEQIIHSEYTNEGVVAVVNLPADMIDPVYSNIQNMTIKGFLYKKPIFNDIDPKKVERYDFIPFEENQIVYINNGMYNETKEFIIPFIENCRRAYRQLSMIEDSVVIHRMVHAPLRFVFNVDVGRLPVPQAEAYLRKLQAQYWSTKTFDIDQGDIVKKYSPQSTLDSYWFAKRQGQEPTTVQEIGGQMSDGNLDVLDWFVKKLYRSLKTPTGRLNSESIFSDGTEILREELKLARMIERQQQKFASGLKRGFITHLKMRNMFDNDNYEVSEQNINVKFNIPTNFYELRENQKMELKVNMYNNLVGSGNISDSFAKKKILDWTDREILADRELRKSDAALSFEIQQIMAMGPGWKEQMLSQANSGAPESGDIAGGAPSGGSQLPPDFGGGPADTSGNEDVQNEPQNAPPPPPGDQQI